MDQLHFRPGWVELPQDEWLRLIAEIAARDEWIIEGGYTSSFPIRMPRVDTIIWLDLPRRVCFPRILKRLISTLGGSGRMPRPAAQSGSILTF